MPYPDDVSHEPDDQSNTCDCGAYIDDERELCDQCARELRADWDEE
jgi:predicted amidophosphoribosyltransferase